MASPKIRERIPILVTPSSGGPWLPWARGCFGSDEKLFISIPAPVSPRAASDASSFIGLGTFRSKSWMVPELRSKSAVGNPVFCISITTEPYRTCPSCSDIAASIAGARLAPIVVATDMSGFLNPVDGVVSVMPGCNCWNLTSRYAFGISR